ncbi:MULTISPECIES: folylpolyglutamate synthase/dihydrofolate synthase family protein [Peptoniphilus]|mgnify:CR=1 FL=1|uniref:bifunctional folylpolyglutamate synthase/dihydrofolate synthase n=1 Tax=Peptoniphilus TaxID=162289 RepID=UPI0002892C9C|nr:MULTISPECIES: folylpolyglutamate synthase/dihydrofolate synthase family protein [Peptoniphilus]MBS6610737.1 bifunctional folylpolyglutamate synthase/dihydrofolate synthase [Peptoniphilus harei]MDU1042937.1 folylpolyglutamate synthase/dihydrofolate synthase family protein [Peptoniphilus rhinitidis]MDU1954383.1 folylpolyglutamate synthase/dihydrofolate synthase family protein [Peptoniphilus lacydonensis]MDU2109343.1 folylpolyglutamate synthase/dihydrofolate synthase family protein [Peptoniphil
MTYQEVVKDIEGRIGKFKSKGNVRIRKFLEKNGSPHKNLKVIHVAGTNGKGSTVNFIKDILKEDYKVGSFVSPHLITYCDRIKIGDAEISRDDFADIGEFIINRESEIIEEYGALNLFEFLTIMAIVYFEREKVDLAILEVGMGGRADSTNIFTSREKLISIITSISMDHMEYLGSTIEEIASAKAGIVTEGGLVVTTNKDRKILRIINKEVEEKNAEIFYTKNLESEIIKSSLFGIDFKLKLDDWESFILTQIGDYQVENAIGAIYALYLLNKKKILKISLEKIKSRIEKSTWAGRMEIVSRDPLMILDGAHNFDGIKKLVESIDNFKFKKLHLIMSILSDKEHKKMLEEISNYTDEVVFVNLDYKRGTNPEELKREAADYGLHAEVMNVEDAINYYKEKYQDGDLILVTGSLYFVSEARSVILNYKYSI